MATQKKTAAAGTGSFSVSLVIPCYNEAHRVDALLIGLEEFARQWRSDYEIIVVNDGSKDNTVAVIEQSAIYKELSAQNKFKLVSLPQNGGKGNALKQGVATAAKDFILTLDADLSTHPLEAASFAKILKPNRIVIASREHPDSKITEIQSRKLTGRIFNFFVRLFTPLTQSDTQCGFKLYPNAVAKQLFGMMKTGGWSHDVELLYRAKLSGYDIQEMPVTWEARDGSKINVVSDALKMFFNILALGVRMRLEWFVGAPLKYLQGKQSDLAGHQPVWRMTFFLWLLACLIGYSALSFSFGITGDEYVQKTYGELILKWFQSGGEDKRALEYRDLYRYGGLFDTLTAVANKYIGGLDEYDMRHLINSWFGWLTLVFSGLLAYRLLDWRAAAVTVILLSLSPQFLGQSMNNPKDIPFAFSYVFTIYYLFLLIREVPRPRRMTWRMIALGIAVSINIRAGGLILFGMLGVFLLTAFVLNKEWRNEVLSFNKTTMRFIGNAILVCAVGYFGGLLVWPFGLQAPLSNPMRALSEFTNFEITIRLLFNGEHIPSNQVPWNYIPIWIGITTPLIILIGAALFAVSFFLFRKRFALHQSLLLLFVTLFPWSYAAWKDSPLYDGMRHFLFLYPFLVVMAALFFDLLSTRLNQRVAQYVVYGVVFASMLLPVSWMIRNHPNAYTYFNETIGGIKGAYGRFETDYWMNSAREASEWLRSQGISSQAGSNGKVVVATNMIHPVQRYFHEDTSKVKVIYSNFRDRMEKDWDYAIFYSRFIEREQLLNGSWMGSNPIYKAEADGIPLSVVIRRKDKSDFLAQQAMNARDFPRAVSLFHQAVRNDPENDNAWVGLGTAYLNTSKPDSAVFALSKAIELNPSSDNGVFMLGYAYAQTGNIENAIAYLNMSIERNPGNFQAYQVLGMIYQQRGDKQTAQQYFAQARQIQQAMKR